MKDKINEIEKLNRQAIFLSVLSIVLSIAAVIVRLLK